MHLAICQPLQGLGCCKHSSSVAAGSAAPLPFTPQRGSGCIGEWRTLKHCLVQEAGTSCGLRGPRSEWAPVWVHLHHGPKVWGCFCRKSLPGLPLPLVCTAVCSTAHLASLRQPLQRHWTLQEALPCTLTQNLSSKTKAPTPRLPGAATHLSTSRGQPAACGLGPK